MIDYTVEARIAYLSWLDSEDSAAISWLRIVREYANGEHPVYLTDRQKEFIGLKAKSTSYLYSHNLCGLIVDTVVERLKVAGFAAAEGGAESETIASYARQWWEANREDAGQDDLYEAVVRDGQAYLIPDWDGTKPRWTLNYAFDGTQGCRTHDDPSTSLPVFVSKRWQTYDPFNPELSGLTRLNLYFPDRVEKYINTKKGDGISGQLGALKVQVSWKQWQDPEDKAWPVSWVDVGGAPLGIAAVRFANPGGSEISDVVSLQDLLNKADLDLIASQDISGFRILFASGLAPDIDFSTGLEKVITLSPGHFVRLTDPAARLGAIEPSDLSRMIETCRYWIESIAAVSRTPQYLFRASGADQPSGESLKQQEIGLLSKCERKHGAFGNSWEDVAYLSAKLWTLNTGQAIPLGRLQVQWKPVQTKDDRETWELATLKQGAGVPKEQTWAEAGYTPEQIAAMRAMAQREEADKANSLALAMVQQERNFDRGQGAGQAGEGD